MNKALKVAWIQRINSENGASWKIIPEIALKKHGGLTFLIKCNYDVNTLQTNNLPPFYHEILKQWQITKDCTETLHTQDDIIWNNQKILINCNPLFFKSWFDKNIIRVGDLLQKEGKFLSFENFCTKFRLKVPFTLYLGLINAIEPFWKLPIGPRHAKRARTTYFVDFEFSVFFPLQSLNNMMAAKKIRK